MHLCQRCAGRVELVIEPTCPACGHPFLLPDQDICPHCLDFTARFGEARVVVMAKGPVRALIHELKYHHGLHVLADIERAVRENPEFLAWLRGATLVPVPLHPAKERHRGYNQSQLLAELFARAAGGATTVAPVLVRQVFTQSQTKHDRFERLHALTGVFALRRGVTVAKGQRHVVVDDVLTTGSTLSHCADVLVRAGLKQVDACAFGHG